MNSLEYYITKHILCVYRSPAVVRLMIARKQEWAGHVAVSWGTLEYIQIFLLASEHFEKL